jgi:hypothetical protein
MGVWVGNQFSKNASLKLGLSIVAITKVSQESASSKQISNLLYSIFYRSQ